MAQTQRSWPWRAVAARVATWLDRQKEPASREEETVGGRPRCRRCGTPACSCSEAETDAGGPGD